MNVVEVDEGDSPVILAQPHGGTHVPEELYASLNAVGRELADTDWHIGRLYDGLLPGATVVASTVHRYVIDANRDPSGVSLYPGQNTTTLCPLTDFDGRAIWQDGQEPSETEIARRRAEFHDPYHAALAGQIARVHERHGIAILYDCHSIRSVIPFLFDGTLADFNTGTNSGTTCAPEVERVVTQVAQAAQGYGAVVNGRFKGGWTTRHYGQPAKGVHAIQMELAQRTYMDEAAPWTFRQDRADRLRPHLRQILTELDALARSGALSQQGAAR